MDSRGAVGYRHEESDAEPQSLQQDHNQPLWPIEDHVLDGIPPAMLYHTVHKTSHFFARDGVKHFLTVG